MPRTLLLIMSALLVVAGCTSHRVRVRGVAPMNVNGDGESTPVDVRFYPLRDQARFQAAAFEALWVEGERILASDLAGPVVVATVLPGSAGDPPRRVDLGVDGRWIGVLALVRRSDGTPRSAVIPADRLEDAVIEVRGLGLRIDGIDLAAAPAAPAEVATPAAATPRMPSIRQGRP